MSGAAPDQVALSDLIRGAVKVLPDLPGVIEGLLRMLLLKPTDIGSIGLLIAEHARKRPDALALSFENQRWTYAQFNADANRVAEVLRGQGLKAGDTVAILMENRPQVLICVAAVLKLGAVAGMLNHQQRGDVLSHSLRLTAPRVIIVGEECREALGSSSFDPATDSARTYVWDGDAPAPDGFVALRPLAGSIAKPVDPPVTAGIKLLSPAFYIFTSGTTGMPKASVMTHFRWMKGMWGLSGGALRLRQSDIFYCCLPLYHNNALTVSWGAVLSCGAGMALTRKFSASKFWDEIRASGSTSFCYIGELCRYLLNQPANEKDRRHQVRVIVGNGLRPEIWDAFQSRFGIDRICEFYGASESNLAFVNAWGVARTAGYCPLSYAIARFDADAEAPFRDARNRLQRVETGGVGLLLAEVTRSAPFDGYTDAKATESKLLRNVFKDGDCWFNTGDLVRDQGWRHIAFVDRVGDTFRWKGENVATTEVEAALCAFDSIDEAVVYGVQVPGMDGRAGMGSLSISGRELDGAALAKELRARLPAYAVPLFLRLRTQQDTTSTFKNRKVDLKREAFDPSAVSDPLHVLIDGAYVPMTPEIFARIQRGEVRF